MKPVAFAIDADALHAYADGQLGEVERTAVEAYLRDNPDAAATVAGWRRQNDGIKALFGPIASEPVPARLSPARVAQGVKSERSSWLRGAVAAALIVAVAGGTGWYMRGVFTTEEPTYERLVDQAVVAHSLYVKENTHAVEAPADSPNLMRWLSNRITTQIDAPNLTDAGYKFVGGRLLPGSADTPSPAAQLMYENASAERVTLYITAPLADKKEVWRLEARGGIEAYYWASDAVTCTIVAALPADQVKALGKSVFEQLTRRPDSGWNPAT